LTAVASANEVVLLSQHVGWFVRQHDYTGAEEVLDETA